MRLPIVFLACLAMSKGFTLVTRLVTPSIQFNHTSSAKKDIREACKNVLADFFSLRGYPPHPLNGKSFCPKTLNGKSFCPKTLSGKSFCPKTLSGKGGYPPPP